MDWLNKFKDAVFGREKLTNAAKLIGDIFHDEKIVGQSFFDTCIARFENFDEENNAHRNNAFYEDVNFITQCFNESFKSADECKRFGERIDAYLYAYTRIEEYFEIIKKNTSTVYRLENNVKELRHAIITNASKTFSDTKGLQPNLCTTEKDLLKRMKIDNYRLKITTLNRDDLNTFFCFCKLSFQASLQIDPDKRLQWKAIICEITHFGISLQNLITRYGDFTLGFTDFPLDVPGFVELISRLPPVTKSDESLLSVLCGLLKLLDLKFEEFLKHFLPIFQKDLRHKPYKMIHAADFLSIFSRHERYFAEYLSAYAACVDMDTLWRLFLYLCQISELNEIIQKHLLLKLNERISSISCTKFFDYAELADRTMEQMDEEKRFLFRKVYVVIFNAFIIQQLTDERHRYLYYESDFKRLLKILIRSSLSIKDASQEPSFSLIIQNFVFLSDKDNGNSKEKLKNLVRKLNGFDKEILGSIDPKDVIRTDWIQDSLLLNDPQDFVNKLDVDFYRDLCERSVENEWTIYAWERILHLSFMKPAFANAKEFLVKLNEWMKTVKHDRYDDNDRFTIILINHLFNQVISRHAKLIWSLPKVENIMDFILSLRKQNNEMDYFIQQVERSIKNVLKLQGKL